MIHSGTISSYRGYKVTFNSLPDPSGDGRHYA